LPPIPHARMLIHLVFDFSAWLCAWLVSLAVARLGLLPTPARSPVTHPGYFIALGLGAIAGAVLFGSINMTMAGLLGLGHSIAGAIAGGIVGVEIFKWITGIRGSTGAQFVAPLAAGIAIGRWGCFFAGLPDYTYGIATTLPWGVDFGDGIPRHPVQLYESLSMFLFLTIYLSAIARRSPLFLRQGFYLFVGYYAVQRFLWEFLKPYPAVAGPFNLFQILCAVMLCYSIFMMSRNHDHRQALAKF